MRKEINVKEIERLYETGLSLEEVAQSLLLSYPTVHKYVKRSGLMRSKGYGSTRKCRRRGLTEAKEERIVKLYKKKLSGREISNRIGLPHEMVMYCIKRRGISRDPVTAWKLLRDKGSFKFGGRERKYSLNQRFFSKINKKSAWVVGLLYGDGSLDKSRWTLWPGIDEDVALKVKKLIGYSGPIYKWITRNNTKTYFLKVASSRMIKDLVKVWKLIIGKKSYKIRFPVIKKKKVFSDFIRGLIESDGSICKRTGYRRSIIYTTVSKKFARGLYLSLKRLGFKAHLYSKKGGGFNKTTVAYVVQVNGIRFAEFLYKSSIPKVRSTRYYLRYKKLVA
jgi:transposase